MRLAERYFSQPMTSSELREASPEFPGTPGNWYRFGRGFQIFIIFRPTVKETLQNRDFFGTS